MEMSDYLHAPPDYSRVNCPQYHSLGSWVCRRKNAFIAPAEN